MNHMCTWIVTSLRWARAASAVFALAAVLGCRDAPKVSRPAPATNTVSLMSYNLDFTNPADEETLRAIETAEVDLLLLQEVNAPWERSLRANLSATYPHQVYAGDDGYAAGFAILSRWPITSVQELPRIDWFPAMQATLESPIGPLQALNVHLRPPRSDGGSYLIGHFSTPSVREREIRAYANALHPEMPTVVVGDFNEGDDGRAIRGLEGLGYRNAVPQFEPCADTWHWRIGFITLSDRYDHILYDGDLELKYAEVLRAGRSDHLPVVAIFSASSPPVTRREPTAPSPDLR